MAKCKTFLNHQLLPLSHRHWFITAVELSCSSVGSNSIHILVDNDGKFLGCKGGKELFCLFWLSEMGKCIRLHLRILLELMWAGRRRKRRKTATTCVVCPHSFAGYEANQHEFKFILWIKWYSEIGIHELPTFVMPEWPRENSRLSGLKFHLPLKFASECSQECVSCRSCSECLRQSCLQQHCQCTSTPPKSCTIC